MLFVVSRYKGSTGAINVTWGITVEARAPMSFVVSPLFGELEFHEGQWNSSFHLRFLSIPLVDHKYGIFVKLLNVSGSALLGNFTSVKISFPSKFSDTNDTSTDDNSKTPDFLLPCLGGFLLIIVTAVVVFLCCKCVKR